MQKQAFHILFVAKNTVSVFRGKASKMRSKRAAKIELWAPRGQICKFVGGCLRGLILYESLIRKKIDNKLKNSDGDAKRAIVQQASAAEAGFSRGLWSQQESARV